MSSPSRKRALSELEISNSALSSKRRETESKSPEPAIRDASKAFLETREKTEEAQVRPSDNSQRKLPSKQKREVDANSEKTVDWEFEKDKPTGRPYIYIVLEKTANNRGQDPLSEEILCTFASLVDANNYMRDLCAELAKRDDPEAIFEEGMSEYGGIWWVYQDEGGFERELRIEKCILNEPGCVPAQAWGRPIGAPCPEKED